jgi:hypothetical protein
MNKGRNPLFLLRCCHTESKWFKRRLKLYEQLQLYDISDSVIKPLDEEICVALVNVQCLTPLKMLYGGVEALFSVLPGGGGLIKRKVKLLKGDVPPILSSGVLYKEQKYLRLGCDTGNSEVENEATKHDDAEVPTYLWNDRPTRPWCSLEGPNDTVDVEGDKKLYKADEAIRNKLSFPWWKRNVLRSFRVWFKNTYRTPVSLTPPPSWRSGENTGARSMVVTDGSMDGLQLRSGVTFTIGNHRMDNLEVGRSGIPQQLWTVSLEPQMPHGRTGRMDRALSFGGGILNMQLRCETVWNFGIRVLLPNIFSLKRMNRNLPGKKR